MRRLFITVGVALIFFVVSNSFASVPVTSGLVAHFDAGSITGLADGEVVTLWHDSSGNEPNYSATVMNDAGPDDFPVYAANAIGGLPAVYFDDKDGGWGPSCSFSFPEIANIRTVFWVLKEPFDATPYNRAILGHSSRYDFHRGTDYHYWNGTWANAHITGGTTRENGKVVDGTVTAPPYDEPVIVSLITTGGVSANQLTRDRGGNGLHGDLAEVIIYDRALNSVEENMVGYYLSHKYGISTAYTSASAAYATDPSPADGNTGIGTTGVTLIWDVALASSPKYDVWFGPQGAMTKIASSQDANSYALDTLIQNQVYEWKIDVSDNGTMYPAESSWTFRIIVDSTKVVEWNLDSTESQAAGHEVFITNITATASSQDWGSAASTLNDNGLHGMEHIVYPYGYSWITANGGGNANHPVDGSTSGWGAWIMYQFDTSYPVGNMYIWNQNQVYFSDLTNRGLKNITIKYSTDGITWTSMGSYLIPKATGQNGMAPGLTVNFAGTSARYVVITATKAGGQWGADPGSSDIYYALAKVRFGINGTSANDSTTPDSAAFVSLDPNGIVKGDPQIVPGMSATDNCFDFDGVDDSITSNLLLDPNFPAAGTEQWSMNFYAYLDEAPSPYDMVAGFGALIGYPDGSVRYIINYNNQIYFWGNNAYDLGTGVPFDIAKWQMITTTYDGGNLNIYKNGTLIGSKKISGAFADATPVIHLAAKTMASNNAAKFKGRIDNFSIYRGVLTQSEIDALAEALPLTGNFNRDARVDFADYATFSDRWMTDTVIQGWPTVMLLNMEGANALDAWGVDNAWNAGKATISLIKGDAGNPSDPDQPYAGTQAVRMTYNNSSGSNVWSSVDVSLPEAVDMTKYDLLRFALKRHAGNSREDQMFFRGYSPSGAELFSIAETTYSTDTPAGVWPDAGNNGSVVIWSNQIPFAHEVKTLKIGTYSWSKTGGSGTIDIDNIQLEKFDNCLGVILEGDFNADCVIDMDDLSIFADNWLLTE